PSNYASYDTAWAQIIQAAAGTALLFGIGRNRTQQRGDAGADGTGGYSVGAEGAGVGGASPRRGTNGLLWYLGLEMLLGLAASIMFMLSFNTRELECYGVGMACFGLLRCCGDTQVLCIHPTVSYIKDMWGRRAGIVDPQAEVDPQMKIPMGA
ncbi:hypothetical protein HK104_010286, partial [Borealophlyctis nickersoniae]